MQSKLNNLLFLIESLSGGGAEKVLTTLLQHLDSNKFDVTLCCIVDCGKYVNDVKPYVHYTSILPNPEQITSNPQLSSSASFLRLNVLSSLN